MSTTPLISIIVPVYNVELYLAKCLDSIIAQNYKNLEILLIDDGSTDNSGSICDAYARKDCRIVVMHQANQGVSSARNRGVCIAQGAYIGFVDSDDWIDPKMFETLLCTAQKYGSDISICGHVVHHSEQWLEERAFSHLSGVLQKKAAINYLLDISLYEGYLWNKLFSRKLLQKIGGGMPLRFDPEIHICEDLLFVCQCMLGADAISYTPEVLYHYIVRQGSSLKSFSEKRKTELLARQKIIDLLQPLDQALCNKAKERYVEASVNMILHAVENNQRQKLASLKKEAMKYISEYRTIPNVAFKARLRVFIILTMPVTGYKIWQFLKKRLHLVWG